jgi:GH15 family glucan-1,4-alpha-glucosidase
MSYPPIGDYGLIGDMHSAALVSTDGSIDWLCLPRFDSNAAFGRILDWDRGGHFRIGPGDVAEVTRRYHPDTNVLVTSFQTETGVFELVDCMPVMEDGFGDGCVLRLVRCRRGSGTVGLDLSPRFDFGQTVPRVELESPHRGLVFGGADGILVESEIPMERQDGSAVGSLHMEEGDSASTVLTYLAEHRRDVDPVPLTEVEASIDSTINYWKRWVDDCTYDGPHREAVVRSALVLKLLTYGPTGAILAAPTTSLPEEIGGTRNWDYRYTWLRDAAMNIYALFTLGFSAEAEQFMHWLRWATAGRAADLQVMYGIGGERRLPEWELDLEGYRGSTPVRVGNSATEQFQMDAYGYLLDTAWLFHRHGGEIDDEFWEFLREVTDHLCEFWHHPDHGIWEIRDAPRHFVTSKVFAWVTVDRAVRLAAALGRHAPEHWVASRDRIRAEVLERGIDEETGGFRGAYDLEGLDASALMLPLVRFIAADDPRMVATVSAIESELARDGLVRRYLTDDGLPPGEGAFLICSYWLVDNLAMAGEVEKAEALFERLNGYANDLGLLPEEIDARDGTLLGNYPQAFSHVGLIGAAINLARASGGS